VRRAPGELEAEVLTALWAADGPATAAEVQAQVGGELATTTVLTILTRLMAKDQVERVREPGERVYRYAVTRERAEHAADQMHAFLGSGEERRATLARFVSRLSRAERRAMAELLQRNEDHARRH
jgi:predicted transcriptional regulator